MKIIEFLRGCKSHPLKKSLLEMADEEKLDMADIMAMPMPEEDAVPADAPAEEQVVTAFKAIVMAIMDDETLDAMAKVDKIKAVLASQETVIDAVSGGGESTTPTTEEEDPEKKEEIAAEVKESINSLRKTVSKLQQSIEIRDLLESYGMVGIDQKRRSLLENARTKADRVALLESWPRGSFANIAKPTGVVAASSGSSDSYEELKKERDASFASKRR